MLASSENWTGSELEAGHLNVIKVHAFNDYFENIWLGLCQYSAWHHVWVIFAKMAISHQPLVARMKAMSEFFYHIKMVLTGIKRFSIARGKK